MAADPYGCGSPTSLVAEVFESLMLPDVPEMDLADAKKSLFPVVVTVTEFERADQGDAPALDEAETLNE